MIIENHTRHSDRELEAEIRAVERLMNWPAYQGGIRFAYLRWGKNRWRGRFFFTARGYIKIRWTRTFKRMNYKKHGHTINPKTGRECRGVAIAHELAHKNGLDEPMAHWAEAEYLRRKRAQKRSTTQ